MVDSLWWVCFDKRSIIVFAIIALALRNVFYSFVLTQKNQKVKKETMTARFFPSP
jgi:hypothetical protein